MSLKIIYVPLDNRPVNFDRFILSSKLYRCEVIYPPVDLLGNFYSPGMGNKICHWLQKQANAESDTQKVFLISSDMLCYGGLFFSRKLLTTFNGGWQRILTLKKVKTPKNKIYVFSVIPRLTISVTNDEEKIYWEKIFQYSVLADKVKKNPDFKKKFTKLIKEIPSYLIEEYLTSRKRNLNINLKLLELVKDNFIDFLILAQEDAHKEGLHKQEQNILNKFIKENKLQDKVKIFTGADEIAYLLFTKIILEKENPKLEIKFYFSDNKVQNCIPLYEDKTFKENLKQKISFLLKEKKLNYKNINFNIFVNSFTKKQKDLMFTEPTKLNAKQDLKLLKVMQTFVKQKNQLAFLDIKYGNGGDYNLMQEVFKILPPKNFVAYSGWNTVSNSLGTLLAHLILYYINFQTLTYSGIKNFLENHLQLLFVEFCDDLLYQGYVRKLLIAEAEKNNIPLWNFKNKKFFMQKKLQHFFVLEIQKFFKQYFANQQITFKNENFIIKKLSNLKVSLPWDRLFEVKIECKIKIQEV